MQQPALVAPGVSSGHEAHDVFCQPGREPLVVWQEAGVLLDGHNRYALCQAHALPFDVHALSLPSREDAINWIINNQLGRRNLTEAQKSYLRGKRYQQEKKREG